MQIKSIALQNFRNHKTTVLNLSPGLNVLVGNNAQGKTNLLEAIYLTCVGRGFRTPRDRELIRFGEKVARVRTVAVKKIGEVKVEVVVSIAPGRAGKQIKINEIPIARMGELMSTVTCVFFSPDELKLIKEAPSDRRRFMDVAISQMDKVYFYNLLRYNKVLQQRNALLKTMGRSDDEMKGLDIWDEQLAVLGESIVKRRNEFCEQLKPYVREVHKNLAPREAIEINYNTIDVLCNEGGLLQILRSMRERDLRLGTTTVGPHRDDILIMVDGRDVRSFASQGQQRTVALSMKVAELKIFESVTGERPVLLLDDVFSELDGSRQQSLLEVIDGYQAVVTATEYGFSKANVKVFDV